MNRIERWLLGNPGSPLPGRRDALAPFTRPPALGPVGSMLAATVHEFYGLDRSLAERVARSVMAKHAAEAPSFESALEVIRDAGRGARAVLLAGGGS